MGKQFSLVVEVINGEIQEFPVTMTFPCELITPVGELVIRDYDSSVNFIIAKRVFLIRFGNNVFGTTTFKTLSGFLQYQGANCGKCACTSCPALINGCYVLINGCTVDMCNGCTSHEITINNCSVLINGCQALLN